MAKNSSSFYSDTKYLTFNSFAQDGETPRQSVSCGRVVETGMREGIP
jgi:hypothetical protein